MRERLLSHWRGVALTLVCVVATLWLAATGQLDLYIHPDYAVFAIVMSVLAGLASLVAAAVLPSARAEDDIHEHETEPRPHPGRTRRVGTILATTALFAGTTVALVVLPPATLSSATAAKREINTTAAASDLPDLVAGDGSSFSVKEWAAVLRRGLDESFLASAAPDVSGFIVPHPDAPDDVFYVTRFVIAHCALDAQPVGVPVYLPGWQDEYAADEWVRVTGAFDPRTASDEISESAVLVPGEVAGIEQPADPYVY